MRIPIKTKYGSETILSEEDALTFSELSFLDIKKGTEYEKKPFDQIFYIDDGIVRVMINGSTLEWGYSKTFIIKANVKYQITPKSIPVRVFRLAFNRKRHESFEPNR